MTAPSPKLWVNAGAISHLLSVAEQLDLSPTDMAVLLQHCAMAQVGSLETWCAQDTLCTRTKLGLTAIKAAVKRLEWAGILEFVRHRRQGIKLYRLHLPGLVPGESIHKPATESATEATRSFPAKAQTHDPRFTSAI